jgi:hypothetical protein
VRVRRLGALIDAAEACRLSRGQTGFADDATTQAAEALIDLLAEDIARVRAPTAPEAGASRAES